MFCKLLLFASAPEGIRVGFKIAPTAAEDKRHEEGGHEPNGPHETREVVLELITVGERDKA